jgi:hypothetical protein
MFYVSFDSFCVRVEPRAARLVTTVDHKSPALFGEFYKVHVSLVSQEEHAVNDVRSACCSPLLSR